MICVRSTTSSIYIEMQIKRWLVNNDLQIDNHNTNFCYVSDVSLHKIEAIEHYVYGT